MNPLYILCSEHSTCMHKENPRPIESLLWADYLNFEKNVNLERVILKQVVTYVELCTYLIEVLNNFYCKYVNYFLLLAFVVGT